MNIDFWKFFGISDAYAATTTAGAHVAGQAHGSIWQMLLLPALLILVFYFLLIRPQSRRAKEQRSMLDKISIGDEVMTAGGILGKIVRLRDNYVVLQIAKSVEITLQKSSVATLLPKGTVETVE